MKQHSLFPGDSISRSMGTATLGILVWLGLNLLPVREASGQGTVRFENFASSYINAPVYGPETPDNSVSKTGNTTAGTPAGTQIYTGSRLSGSGYRAQMFGGVGMITDDTNLLPAMPITTFRSGSAAGYLPNGIVATLQSVPVDAPQVTIQIRAWDNTSGLYLDWASVKNAWQRGDVAAGKSPLLVSGPAGGYTNSPLTPVGLVSFNIYYICYLRIDVQPTNQNVSLGQPAAFSVTAAVSCPPTSYQWVHNGTPVSGANNSTYNIPSVQVQDAGSYYATVSDRSNSTNSDVAVLTVSGTISTSSSPPGSGTTTGGGICPVGANVTVTATANPCYGFLNWTEGTNVVSTSPSYAFTVNGNRTLVANFALLNYTISSSAWPPLGGTVTGAGVVPCSSNVTLCATPTACNAFVNWTEGASMVSAASCYTFTVTGDRSLVANFAPAPPALTFSASTYAVGNGPNCLVATDVNSDGKLDLVSANYANWSGSTLTVLTNNGSGAFGSNATLNVGTGPACVLVSDVNADNKPDLVSVNYGGYGMGNTLTVLTNNGSGSFGSNATLTVAIGPFWGVAADIHGDGKPDLVSANFGMYGYGGTTLTVLTNNGSGTFGFNATLQVGQGPRCAVAADVNSDGKPDLITANYGIGTLTVLTNNRSGGFGFRATLNVGMAPTCVVAADVNVDGKPDLISANSGTNTLTLLTNDGSGGFVSSATLNVGPNPYSVATADLNGDGKLDLISANTGDNTLTVLTNNGSGGFILCVTLGVASAPKWLVAADLNGDGRPDLITANAGTNTLSVLLNTTVYPAPPIISRQPAPASQTVNVGDTAAFTVVAGGGQSLAYLWQSVIAGVTNAVGSGVTSGSTNMLTLANVQPSQAGAYFVTIAGSSPCGWTNSALASLAVASPPRSSNISASRWLPGGGFQFDFTNAPGAPFSVLAATNLALRLSNWTPLTGLSEVSPGQFQFTDPQATDFPQRFYRVRSP